MQIIVMKFKTTSCKIQVSFDWFNAVRFLSYTLPLLVIDSL